MHQPEKYENPKLYFITRTAVMSAAICVLAPLSVPIKPVAISMATLVLYFSVYLLDWKMAAASALTYIVLGAAGLPVFSGFAGGIGVILGPSGGYIMGYIPMVIAAGLVIDHSRNRFFHLLALLAGTALCYLTGTAWYCHVAGVGLQKALGLCVLPFLPLDLVKMVLSMLLGPVIRKQLVKARLLKV